MIFLIGVAARIKVNSGAIVVALPDCELTQGPVAETYRGV